jgi:hypothetical protein
MGFLRLIAIHLYPNQDLLIDILSGFPPLEKIVLVSVVAFVNRFSGCLFANI